jgi:putative heme-binding domain-containing protein
MNLTRLTDRSPRSLLVHTIDPNRLADHQYSEYTVLTDDGRQFVGMMLEETSDSITFAHNEGEEQVVNRSEIDELVCNAGSHMPEGLEARPTLQKMADLLAFMTAATPGSPSQ